MPRLLYWLLSYTCRKKMPRMIGKMQVIYSALFLHDFVIHLASAHFTDVANSRDPSNTIPILTSTSIKDHCMILGKGKVPQ